MSGGRTLLVTRAKGDEATLMEALQASGVHAIHEPLTEIFLNHTARYALQSALLREPHGVIATSRHGVRALASLTAWRDMALLCVGEATAEAAADCGFTRVSAAGGHVARLVEMIRGAYESGARFIYVSAQHVRADVPGLLAAYGMPTERLIVYEATPASSLSDTLKEQLRRGQVDGAVFMSQQASRVFVHLLNHARLTHVMRGMEAYCISEIVALPLRSAEWGKVHIAPKPALASLLECIDNGHA